MKALIIAVLCAQIFFLNASQAFIYPFDNEDQTYQTQGMDSISEHQLNQLIKYNLGLMEHPQGQGEEEFQKIITSYGKGNIMNPIDMTYLMLIQSDQLIKSQESKQARITEGYVASLNVVDKADKSILDQLFADHEFSMVNRAQRNFKNDEEHGLPFIIYQNEDNLDVNFLHWTVTLYLGQNKEVYFYQPKTDKSFKIESSLEKCVDFFFGSTFDYSPSDMKIYKYNTNEFISITPENQDFLQSFLKDVCAMNKLSQTFKPGKSPNFLAFINKSVSQLEKVLSEPEISLVYDMMRIAHKKLSKNLKNFFDSEDLFGLIIVEEEKNPQVTTKKEAAKVQRILMETKSRMLNQANEGSTTLQQTTPMSLGTFQIYVWFGIFMVFVLYFTLYSMFTMDIQKDTLLYAKFLTNDGRN